MKTITLILICLLLKVSLTFSQTIDSIALFKDSINKFQFNYSTLYKLKVVSEGYYLISQVVNDSIKNKLSVSVEKFASFEGTENFSGFVKRMSSALYDAGGPDENIMAEGINSEKHFKNAYGANIVQLYENIDCSFNENDKVNHIYCVQGPVYFFDLSIAPEQKNTAIIINPCLDDVCVSLKDKNILALLDQIAYSLQVLK